LFDLDQDRCEPEYGNGVGVAGFPILGAD
jgi:hypothetical protein